VSELQAETQVHSPRRLSPTARAARKRRRAVAFGALLGAALAVLAVTAATLGLHFDGSAASSTSRLKSKAGRSAASKRASRGIRVTATVKPIGNLASGISAGSAVALNSAGALFFGGLDSAATPLDEIQSFDGTSTSSPGQLPVPLAGSGAARLGSSVYLFGGADSDPTSSILALSSTGANPTNVGELPQPTVDAAVAVIGDTAYVIGGYSGSADLDSIVSFSAANGANNVATLPQPLTDAAAVAVGGEIYIVGGSESGTASKAIYRFDPNSDKVSKLKGALPIALTQTAVASLDHQIIVLGGQGNSSGSETDAIFSIAPSSGHVTRIGSLPLELAGADAVGLAGKILLGGGVEPSGQASSTIYAIKVS
jgi:N-acetylneuraminic acid mutarotase